MRQSDNQPVDFVEVFPVGPSIASALSAYELEIGGTERNLIGGKLAYRLLREVGGHWVWTSNRLVTDNPQDDDRLEAIVSSLWRDQPDTYKDLRGLRCDESWLPNAQVPADFVARGLFRDIYADIRNVLATHEHDLGSARVERAHEVRGWVVDGEPSVSLSISSRLIYRSDLAEYARSVTRPDDLKGLWVGAKQSTLKGEIVEIAGPLHEHRTRLLSLTQEEETQQLLRSAPDEEVVVRVASGRNEYDYAASALRIILRTSDFARFRIRATDVTKALRLAPSQRASIVKEIADLAKSNRLIGDGYNSRSHPGLFLSQSDLDFHPELRLGSDVVREYREANILNDIKRHGLYCPSPSYQGQKIRVGLLKGTDRGGDELVSNLSPVFEELGHSVELSCTVRLPDLERSSIERAVSQLADKGAQIVLAVLPDDVGEDEDDWGVYHNLKSITIGRGIPSQAVYKSTARRKHAFANIVLGMLAKTGSIPYTLAKPLPYADMVLGLDIARERKRQLAGSLNATAVARIYLGDGQLLRYVIHDAPLEGETIPRRVMEGLFPEQEFQGKQVVVHRDGYFRGDEKRVLRNWGQSIGAQFHLVEVIKTGAPRTYRSDNKTIVQPTKGTLFRLSDREGWLVSSLPPFQNATPQPLHLRTEPPFTIENAAHSVLSMTLLHFGSVRAPRLPVTIHYSDRIAYMALRGIKPRELEGTIPYWL